jgi:hypothetical protein
MEADEMGGVKLPTGGVTCEGEAIRSEGEEIRSEGVVDNTDVTSELLAVGGACGGGLIAGCEGCMWCEERDGGRAFNDD